MSGFSRTRVNFRVKYGSLIGFVKYIKSEYITHYVITSSKQISKSEYYFFQIKISGFTLSHFELKIPKRLNGKPCKARSDTA